MNEKIIRFVMLTILSLMLILGCASSPRSLKMYAGPVQPQEKVATLLVPDETLHVISIDRHTLARRFDRIELFPGWHEVALKYEMRTTSRRYAGGFRTSRVIYRTVSLEPFRTRFKAKVGHVYVVKYEIKRTLRGGSWRAWVEDLTADPKTMALVKKRPKEWAEAKSLYEE